MSKLIVAVKSSQQDRDAGFHDAIRETWGRDLKALGVDTRFFVAADTGPKGRTSRIYQKDEVALDCSDDRNSLPFKTREICRWAQAKVFTHLFLCSTKTFVIASKLEASGYEVFDYSGHFKNGGKELGRTFFHSDQTGQYPQMYDWAVGSDGYFLSATAVMSVANEYPNFWAEDMYVGQVLGPEIAKFNALAAHLNIRNVATRSFENHESYTPDLLRLIQRVGLENV